MKNSGAGNLTTQIHEYFSTERAINTLEWREHFSLKQLDHNYVAQGILEEGGRIYHTIHKRNAKSVLIIFDRRTPEYRVIKELILPKEATHTSDLTLYRGNFYAIDYNSNYIYQFDFTELKKHLRLRLIKKV